MRKSGRQPIVVATQLASNVAELLLALVFMLDRPGQPEQEEHSRQQLLARNWARDQ